MRFNQPVFLTKNLGFEILCAAIKLVFDPAQKRLQAPDSCRGEINILDFSSSSQIHLWSKSKI